MIVGDFNRNPEADFGDLWGSIKKAAKKVGSAASSAVAQLDPTSKSSLVGKVERTSVGKILLAPVMALPMAEAKVGTWALSKTGLKPFKKLESEMHRITTKTPIKGVMETGAVEAATAAAVAATVFTGGGAAAGIAAALPGGIAMLKGASMKDVIPSFIGGVAAGAAVNAGSSVLDSIGKAPAGQTQDQFQQSLTQAPSGALQQGQSAAQPSGGGMGLVAGAGAGFLVGGPLGAVVGAVAGHFLTKPKAV